MTHIPAITLYQRIKTLSLHDKISQILTSFIFSSARKRSKAFARWIKIIFRMCIILSSFQVNKNLPCFFLFQLKHFIWIFFIFCCLKLDPWVCKKYLSKLATPLRASEWTPVGMWCERWWKFFYPKIYADSDSTVN